MTTMTFSLLLILAGAAGPEFELRTTDGEKIAGTLAELSDGQIAVETPAGRQSFASDQLAGLKPVKAPTAPAEEPAAWVELVDGSTLPLFSYAVKDGQASLETVGHTRATLSTRAIASVRFKKQSAGLAAQWAEIRKTDRAGDSIVIRKKESLDYQGGVAGDVSEDRIEFSIDGETLSVKRSRVEGLIYFHPAGSALPESFCRVTDAAGARLEVATAKVVDGALQVGTPAGLKLRIDLGGISGVDGKIQFLSDLEPETVAWTPFFGETDQPPLLEEFYRPRWNQALSGGALMLGGVRYGKGIAMYGGSEVTYRLPEGRFGKLKALAGIDDRARPGGNARLLVYGDDKLLFEAALNGRDQPVPVEVDLTGVNRLKLKAEFGDEQEVLDYLDVCDARILK
ncbi:MAG TPA: NPCBM/NEW2 domain-containing protein [Pirellulales bacterium]|nr:NPCBM/NEW2 domain-containing protein [Pirellulales bacterium]